MENPQYYHEIPKGRYKGWAPRRSSSSDGQRDLFLDQRRQAIQAMREKLHEESIPSDHPEVQYALGWYKTILEQEGYDTSCPK